MYGHKRREKEIIFVETDAGTLQAIVVVYCRWKKLRILKPENREEKGRVITDSPEKER
jgi:hypothetical protein